MSLHEHLRNTNEARWWTGIMVILFGRAKAGDGGYVYHEYRGKGYFSHRMEIKGD